jgi:hypothetical protein
VSFTELLLLQELDLSVYSPGDAAGCVPQSLTLIEASGGLQVFAPLFYIFQFLIFNF